MKKINLLILLMLILTLNINYVKAEDGISFGSASIEIEEPSEYKETTCDDIEKSLRKDSNFELDKRIINIIYDGGDREYPVYQLNLDSQYHYAYCRNPGMKSASSSSFKCVPSDDTRLFYSAKEATTTKNKAIKARYAYEKGIVEILKRGDYAVNKRFAGDELNIQAYYTITNIALRLYEMMWEAFNTNGDNTRDFYLVLKSYAVDYNSNSEIKNLVTEIQNALSSQGITNVEDYIRIPNEQKRYTITDWKNLRTGDIYTTQMNRYLADYIATGLQAALDFLENGAPYIEVKKEKDPVKTIVKDAVTGKDVQTITITRYFDVYNFKKETYNQAYRAYDDRKIELDFECSSCKSNNVNVEFGISNVAENIVEIVNENDLNQVDLLNYVDGDGNGKIKFTITFSLPDDQVEQMCQNGDIEYKLILDYTEEDINVDAFNVISKNCKTSGCQQFYILVANEVDRRDIYEDEADLCSKKVENCNTWKEDCEKNNNQDACNKYNDPANNCTGVECTAEFQNSACTEDDSEIVINEGYELDKSTCVTSLNVKDCVINSADEAGNSYEAKTAEYQKVINNPYCSVWCKEDYHITLPGMKEANSGRYFSLQASIQGTKTCYTSEIDTVKFEKDIEEKRRAVINAWNEWNKWYTGANTSSTYHDSLYIDTEQYCSGGFDDDNQCLDPRQCFASASGYTRTWEYVTYTYNKSPQRLIVPASFGGSNDSQDGGSAVCDSNYLPQEVNGNETTLRNNILNRLSTATTNLNNAIKAYTNLLNQFNSCSGVKTVKYDEKLKKTTEDGWKMEYNYNPTISFWYEESYMNNVITDELETIGGAIPTEVKQSFCTSDVNDEYETCTIGWKAQVDQTDTTSQFVCKQTGTSQYGPVYECKTEDIVISKAKYVKQNSEVSANYITPTQFYSIYPSGAIVVAPAGQEDSIENSSELTNLLPVGLGTTQGTYNYTLQVKNLGEYYDKKEIGRIWGDEDSVVVTLLNSTTNNCIMDGALVATETIKGETFEDGVYICAYKINYPDACPPTDPNYPNCVPDTPPTDPVCPSGNCPVECDPVCKSENCPDNDCPVECINCIYTNNSTNISYRPITPNDINPNDRELGPNWVYGTSTVSTVMQLKARVTTDEIQSNGESIYNVDFDNPTQSSTDFAMKVTLDRELINKIKTYNSLHENYANNTLKCYNHKGKDGIEYDNIYCYSTFIDELLYDNNTKDNIKFVGGNRVIGTDETSSDKLRKSDTQSSGYWTSWDEATWSVTTQFVMDAQSNYKSIGIGPSWK